MYKKEGFLWENQRYILQKIIFKETTTIGIRYHYEYRTELERELITLDTKYGKLKTKKVVNNGETYIYPEYESMKELAEKNHIPLKEIYNLKFRCPQLDNLTK